MALITLATDRHRPVIEVAAVTVGWGGGLMSRRRRPAGDDCSRLLNIIGAGREFAVAGPGADLVRREAARSRLLAGERRRCSRRPAGAFIVVSRRSSPCGRLQVVSVDFRLVGGGAQVVVAFFRLRCLRPVLRLMAHLPHARYQPREISVAFDSGFRSHRSISGRFADRPAEMQGRAGLREETHDFVGNKLPSSIDSWYSWADEALRPRPPIHAMAWLLIDASTRAENCRGAG